MFSLSVCACFCKAQTPVCVVKDHRHTYDPSVMNSCPIFLFTSDVSDAKWKDSQGQSVPFTVPSHLSQNSQYHFLSKGSTSTALIIMGLKVSCSSSSINQPKNGKFVSSILRTVWKVWTLKQTSVEKENKTFGLVCWTAMFFFKFHSFYKIYSFSKKQSTRYYTLNWINASYFFPLDL